MFIMTNYVYFQRNKCIHDAHFNIVPQIYLINLEQKLIKMEAILFNTIQRLWIFFQYDTEIINVLGK